MSQNAQKIKTALPQVSLSFLFFLLFFLFYFLFRLLVAARRSRPLRLALLVEQVSVPCSGPGKLGPAVGT